MNFVIKPYPYNKDCVFAITIDDLHPEDKNSGEGFDFGYDLDGDFWSQLRTLHSLHPEVCFTLFTVPNWIDKRDFPYGPFWPIRKIYRKRRHYANGTFDISDPKYSSWISSLNAMKAELNLEFAMHGYCHHNENTNYGGSQEFAGLSSQEISQNLLAAHKLFEASQLHYSKGFRPPGWGISNELSQELAKHCLYIAASGEFTRDTAGQVGTSGLKGVAISHPTLTDSGLVNFTANAFAHQTQRIVTIAEQEGVIVVHAHIAKTVYGLKTVDASFAHNVSKAINEIKNQTMKHIWFANLEQLANFCYAKSKLNYNIIDDSTVELRNDSALDLYGLTVEINKVAYVIDRIAAGESHTVTTKPTSSSTTLPKVSVILTVFNGATTVIPSLESLCTQTYPNCEIIVVNDGSTDKTAEVLAKYKDLSGVTNLTIINQVNGGRSNSRNTGFNVSTGEIITFCEDDAKYDKDYVQNAVNVMWPVKSKVAGVIGPHFVWNKYASLNTRIKDIERRRNFFKYKPKSCWFYYREVFESVGRFNESLELVEDIEPAIKLSKDGYSFLFVEDCRWLHKEPVSIKSQLRRKFRGGMGMSLLIKYGLKKQIVPLKYSVLLLTLLSIVTALFVFKPIYLLIFMPLAVIFLGLIRLRDLQTSIKVSNESKWLCLVGIYWEYLWWLSTFFGYLYGMTMDPEKMSKKVRGR